MAGLYGTDWNLYTGPDNQQYFYNSTSGQITQLYSQATLNTLFGGKWQTDMSQLQNAQSNPAPLPANAQPLVSQAAAAHGGIVGSSGQLQTPSTSLVQNTQTQAFNPNAGRSLPSSIPQSNSSAPGVSTNNTVKPTGPTFLGMDGNSYDSQGNLVGGSGTSSGSGQTGNADQTGNPQNSGTTGITDPNDPASQLTGQYADLYNQMNQYLQKLTANGQSVNPNVQITPDQIAAFTAQAQNEINPYYANQLATARQSLMQNLGYSQAQIQSQEADLQRQYGNSLRTLAGNLADQGFAQSGSATRGYNDLAASTQSTLDQSRNQLQNTDSNAAAQFAQTYGGANLPSAPTVSNTRALPGQSTFDTSQSSPLYNLSPDIYNSLTGSQQYQQTADINNRVSQLQGAANQSAVNDQTRTLNL